MATFISHSPEETFALGEEWGRAAQPGWLLALTGDLGAGKTQLIKGFARGLGITERIPSPTFALVIEHRTGRLPLAHIDLYRLDTAGQILGAGLDEYFQPRDGVTVVEWCERWPDFAAEPPRISAGTRLRRVKIEPTSETERRITHEDIGH